MLGELFDTAAASGLPDENTVDEFVLLDAGEDAAAADAVAPAML